MFNVSKPSENRIDVEIDGKLDAETMARALDELLAQSENISGGRMLYTISNFEFPSLAAIGVDLARVPKLFGLIGRFEKCAVLADASWIRAAATFKGALFPGLAIKAFEVDQGAEAEAWLAAG